MRDKRPVDELSIEELERILAIKKREARMARLRRLREEGRVVTTPTEPPEPEPETIVEQPEPEPEPEPEPARHVPPSPARSEPDDGIPRLEDVPGDAVPQATMPEPRWASAARRRPTKGTGRKRKSNAWRKFRDTLLLIVEVGAVIGVLLVILDVVTALRELQRPPEGSELAAWPTHTPTPPINLDVVLPSGHTPPTSPGGAQPNYNEIPEHLRPVVQAQMSAPVTFPTPSPESPVSISIPAIGLNRAPIVLGDNWEALTRGVGHHPGSANPGQRGNMVLSAHNDIYGEYFRYLDRLEPGDEIHVFTQTREYVYVVRETQIVEPTDVWVMEQTQDPIVTLISCYPYLIDNQRIVVFAELAEQE